MKIRKFNQLLLLAIIATLGVITAACSKHTEVNELIGTLNQYGNSFENVTTLEEFNEMMTQFNAETAKYADSTAPVDQADRDAILKAIDSFSASVNKSMSKLLNLPEMSDEQRNTEIQILAKDIADCKTLGEVIKVCMEE